MIYSCCNWARVTAQPTWLLACCTLTSFFPVLQGRIVGWTYSHFTAELRLYSLNMCSIRNFITYNLCGLAFMVLFYTAHCSLSVLIESWQCLWYGFSVIVVVLHGYSIHHVHKWLPYSLSPVMMCVNLRKYQRGTGSQCEVHRYRGATTVCHSIRCKEVEGHWVTALGHRSGQVCMGVAPTTNLNDKVSIQPIIGGIALNEITMHMPPLKLMPVREV